MYFRCILPVKHIGLITDIYKNTFDNSKPIESWGRKTTGLRRIFLRSPGYRKGLE